MGMLAAAAGRQQIDMLSRVISLAYLAKNLEYKLKPPGAPAPDGTGEKMAPKHAIHGQWCYEGAGARVPFSLGGPKRNQDGVESNSDKKVRRFVGCRCQLSTFY